MTDTTAPQYDESTEHDTVEPDLELVAASAPATPAAEPLIAGRSKSQPVRVLQHRSDESTKKWADSDERVPVFVVEQDGKQRVFDMPAAPNPSMMLRFLRDLRTNPSAIVELIERACGNDAVDALIDELEGMDPDEANATMQGISQRIQVNIGGGIKR